MDKSTMSYSTNIYSTNMNLRDLILRANFPPPLSYSDKIIIDKRNQSCKPATKHAEESSKEIIKKNDAERGNTRVKVKASRRRASSSYISS